MKTLKHESIKAGHRKIAFMLLCLFAFMSLGAGCTKGLDSETQEASKRVTMNIWAVIDDIDTYQTVLSDYQKLHPNVQLNYRRLRLEEYEKELINALAEDRGPDVFLIHNDWGGEYMPKILPMPASTKVAYRVVTGTIKKVSTYQLQTEPTITLKTYKEQFADAVTQDTIRQVNVSPKPDSTDLQPRVIGLPVSIDTLALYYNKDLLNAAGIPNPPEHWGQFQEQVEKLTKLDAQGNIAQAGAAIGTGRNVERSTDILSVLMIQNGAEMTSDRGDITLHAIPPALQDRLDQPPATQALQFYTDFANPSTKNYTWNLDQPDSLDAFIHGRTAFFFGYSYHLQQIRAGNPKLNLGISKLPQI
ncbi:extracellular solute-binding protein, partial [Candidatus Uhrbacteria bacterium]|nr:extracellular solute-binding protein [Candidatus Uhrbacteria bacterium]